MKRYSVGQIGPYWIGPVVRDDGGLVKYEDSARILAQRDRLLDLARKASHRAGYMERFDVIGSDRLDALCELEDLVAELDKEKQS